MPTRVQVIAIESQNNHTHCNTLSAALADYARARFKTLGVHIYAERESRTSEPLPGYSMVANKKSFFVSLLLQFMMNGSIGFSLFSSDKADTDALKQALAKLQQQMRDFEFEMRASTRSLKLSGKHKSKQDDVLVALLSALGVALIFMKTESPLVSKRWAARTYDGIPPPDFIPRNVAA
jgi:hypothetical protein